MGRLKNIGEDIKNSSQYAVACLKGDKAKQLLMTEKQLKRALYRRKRASNRIDSWDKNNNPDCLINTPAEILWEVASSRIDKMSSRLDRLQDTANSK